MRKFCLWQAIPIKNIQPQLTVPEIYFQKFGFMRQKAVYWKGYINANERKIKAPLKGVNAVRLLGS